MTKRPSRLALHNEGFNLLKGFTGRPVEEDELAWGKNGRPFLKDGFSDFNISHSGKAAMVTFVKKTNGQFPRTGCDLEQYKEGRNFDGIAGNFFPPEEASYVHSLSGHNKVEKFYQIWVLKESYLKLRGLTIGEIDKTPSFVSFDKKNNDCFFCLRIENPVPVVFYLYALEFGESHYYFTAAYEGEDPPESPCFSFLGEEGRLKSIAVIKAAKSPVKTVMPNI
jgi:phosphopantetheinyl transferase